MFVIKKGAMNYLIVILLLHLSCSSISQNDFGWLVGSWERTNVKEGRTAFETWFKLPNDTLVGNGVMIEKGDTLFSERLSIVKKADAWYYIAEVSENAKPVPFKIEQITEFGFYAANPAHDFPKVIEYQLDGSKLAATISGGNRSITFHFIKAEK